MRLRELRRAIPWYTTLLAVAAGSLVVEAFLDRPLASASPGSPPAGDLAVPTSTPPMPPGAGMTVTGILEGATRVAIIQTRGETFIVRVGESVGDAVVAAILPTKVVLRQGRATFELPLASAARRTPLVLASPPAGPAPPGPTPPPPGTGMRVTGILEGSTRVAIIQTAGRTFVAGAGQSAGDAVVVAILPGKVVLRRNGETFELPVGGER